MRIWRLRELRLTVRGLLACALLCSAATARAQEGPRIKDLGTKPYVRVGVELPHREDATWRLVCTLPYNCHFQPWIEVEAPAGKVVAFDSTNPLVRYLTPTETWTTGSGIQTHEAERWVSGEGALYTIPPGVTVRAVHYRETGYDTEIAGAFTCNDHDYEVLWQKAARTAYVCMRDHFYDCPDRERVGFWGDGTPELAQCFYVFDTRAHRLAKELVLRPLEPKFYPGQHLEFLGSYGLWFYYLHTGDLETLRTIYEPTKRFLFETYRFGNPRTWFDWGKEVKDTAVLETCFHYDCLATLRKIALATGHDADVPAIDARLAEVRRTFDERFWRGDCYRSTQVAEPDDRANAMAVVTGLAAPSKWSAIFANVLAKKTYASCFFDRWVFEALCTMGKEDRALLRMAERYRTMIPCRFTTLWEHYDRWWASQIDAFDEGSSLNHGWNPPAILLSQTIAGVGPETPGWSLFHVLPKEAFLPQLRVVVPTVKGKVVADLRKTTTKYALEVTVPPDTVAIVGMPKRPFTKLDTVSVGDVTVWNGTFREGAAGVTADGEDAAFVRFRVGPGTWRFVGHGALVLTSPKPAAVAPPDERPLDSRTWTATASVADGTFPFSGAKIPIDIAARNALDGDPWTGWRDMTRTRHPGQWFTVDMQREQRFAKVVLDTTWALWDSPTGYAVTISNDGVRWSEPIAEGSGQLGITTITFPPQTARYLRITQTGTDATYHWSIYELEVFAAR